MSNEAITYLVAACCGVIGLTAYVWLILVPAWNSYTALWERVAAAFLSLYVFAGFIGMGAVFGVGIVWFWDRIQGA